MCFNLLISAFIFYNSINRSSSGILSSGNDERHVVNVRDELIKKEKIIQYLKNMNYLNILIHPNTSDDSKLQIIEDAMDIIHCTSPFNLYGGGIQNDF